MSHFIQAYYKPFQDNDKQSSYWNILPHTGEIFIGKVLKPIEVDTLIQFISINESKLKYKGSLLSLGAL